MVTPENNPQSRGGNPLHRQARRGGTQGYQARRGTAGQDHTPAFGLSPRQIGRRVKAAAEAAGLGEGFTGHNGRVGRAQDLAKTGAELPALMSVGRWKSSIMPARYTERQTAGRGAVARCYRERGDWKSDMPVTDLAPTRAQ